MFAGVLAQRLQYEHDMVVVDRVDDVNRLIDRIENESIDVVIVGMHNGVPSPSARKVLFDAPNVVVIAIEHTGNQAALYELRPQLVPIGSAPKDLSTDSLLTAIRSAVAAKVT